MTTRPRVNLPWDSLLAGLSRRAEWAIVAAITLLGALLRFAWFSGRMLGRPDEFDYWRNAGGLLARDTTGMIFARPLHTVLQAGPMAIFGIEDWATRFPQAVLGTLTIPLVYLLGRWLFGRLPGLIGAFWFAGAAQPVEASRSAFALSDPLFFVMAGLLVYVAARRPWRPPVSWGTAAAGLLLGMSLVCHPVTVYFILPVLFVEAILIARGPHRVQGLFASCVLLVGIVIPGWFFDVLLTKLQFTDGWQTCQYTYYQQICRLLSGMRSQEIMGPTYYLRYLQLLSSHYLLGALTGLGLLTSIYAAVRVRSPLAGLPALIWAVPVGLWSFFIPQFPEARNVFSAFGVQAVLIGLGSALLLSSLLGLLRKAAEIRRASGASPRVRKVLRVGRSGIYAVGVAALLVGLQVPSWENTRRILTERHTVVWEALQATRSGSTVYFPRRAWTLGRLFTQKPVGRRKFELLEAPDALVAVRPRPRYAVFYGRPHEDWIASFLQLQPIVDGPTTPVPLNTVRVYDFSSYDWSTLMVVVNDGWQEGQALQAAKITKRTHRCRKTLHLPMTPDTAAQARLVYFMQRKPVLAGAEEKRLWISRSDPGVNIQIRVNERTICDVPVTTAATKGWHSVPVPTHVLLEGENEITFRLSRNNRARVFLGVAPSTSVADGDSAASHDAGNTWSTESLSPAHIAQGEPLYGEYIVRLLVRLNDRPHSPNGTESD